MKSIRSTGLYKLAAAMIAAFGWRTRQAAEALDVTAKDFKAFGQQTRRGVDWGRARKPRRAYSNKMRRCAGMTRPHCTNKWRKAEIASK